MTAIVLTLISVPSAQASAPGGFSGPSGDTGAQRLVPRVTGAVHSGAADPNSLGRVTAKVAPESSAPRFGGFPESGGLFGISPRASGEVARSVTLAERGVERCKSARIAAVYFRLRTHSWQVLRDGRLASQSPVVAGKSCHWAKFAARVWVARARSARGSYEKWLTSFYVLHDYTVTAGNRAWHHAIEEAQKAYPDTDWWLLSCSSTEGGHGRWVPNSDGFPPGGWMQMYESTFWRMWGTAWRDVTARGFRVPRSAHSWYSPLGQALASAWGLTNGRRGEWNSSGC